MSWICSRLSFIALFFSICGLYLLSFYFDLKIENILNFRVAYKVVPWRMSDNKTLKTILFWEGMFGDKTFYFGENDIFLNCPVNECYATYDSSYINVEDFDAILFHGAELDSFNLPEKRTTKQYYFFVNLESPVNRPIQDTFFEEYFNATMTYRLDSDVVWPYGIVRDLESDKIVAPSTDIVWDIPDENEDNSKLSSTLHAKDSTLTNTIADKSKEVAWLVSNCPAKSGRWEYVTELSKYIGVDIYGSCGDRYACPYSRDCFRELFEPNYFFYLSFENSLCQDYVTEKLYKAMRYDMIPIVYGGANYSRFAPPISYIDVLNYDSPQDLAKFLKKLIANPREYRKYFRWKKRYRVEHSIFSTACNLCMFLHARNESKTYAPLSDWYSYEKCPLQTLLSAQRYVTKVALKDDTN
ncbi:hypothetical protein KPH14_001012 [Odynerus spinipes]|uniref:Fucosyltransferase n=1 Tax=Odynerus spinipes TaxID=1348599 RepID=A0AAD9RC88_9HYME|nr:hypothetical protein KPH14_001012 [Odynerus spinipes]